jgi:hypothetical protein
MNEPHHSSLISSGWRRLTLPPRGKKDDRKHTPGRSALAFGILAPVKQGYLHHVIPSTQRATVISFNSMWDSAGGVVGQTGLGYLSRQQGIAAGYVAGGAATLLAIPFLLILHGLGDPANRIQSTLEPPPSAVTESGTGKD